MLTRTLILPPKICASIVGTTPSAMKDLAEDAFSEGADFVELRFDFLKPVDLADAIAAAGTFKEKAVYTLRSKSQGGRFAGSEQDRISWLRRMVEQRPMLVDIELHVLKENDELADFLDSQRTPILVSWHDFSSTPSSEELADILSEMRVYSNFVKLVTTAKVVGDALRLLDLYDDIIGLNGIIFAMGEPGVVSRILCTVAGTAPFTYASLDTAVAPGQLSVREMRKIFDKIENRFA
jgi:3-dehydroquinate dehydratase I